MHRKGLLATASLASPHKCPVWPLVDALLLLLGLIPEWGTAGLAHLHLDWQWKQHCGYRSETEPVTN